MTVYFVETVAAVFVALFIYDLLSCVTHYLRVVVRRFCIRRAVLNGLRGSK
jgi:hypothetical protein